MLSIEQIATLSASLGNQLCPEKHEHLVTDLLRDPFHKKLLVSQSISEANFAQSTSVWICFPTQPCPVSIEKIANLSTELAN